MLNKLLRFIRQQDMVKPGDRVICALSGGADSVALLWGLYLLREKLQIDLEAAHFNHNLRAEESDSDEQFVRELCARYDIVLHVGRGAVVAGEKGLEAAARDARYRFLLSLPGKIATAHTADDNAETVLMHMVRGTGLKGLGGIAPTRDRLIRPMLDITRQEVEAFLEEYCLSHIHDSSNDTDAFLRNRLRHHVIPLLHRENPRFSTGVSAMALRLREDESLLQELTDSAKTTDVAALRRLQPGLRTRVLAALLEDFGVREPSAAHIELLEDVIFSEKPSASAAFPGGITVGRNYEKLVKIAPAEAFCLPLPCPGEVSLPHAGLRVTCETGPAPLQTDMTFCVKAEGEIVVRSRREGDTIRLPGGTKSLKKLFIDRKIPAADRGKIPVVADSKGVLAVYGIGVNQDRIAQAEPCVLIRFEEI